MATQNMDNAAINALNRLIPSKDSYGNLRVVYDQITMAAALLNGDVLNIAAPIPALSRFLFGYLLTTATLATSQLTVGFSPVDGSAADPNAYRLAAILTTIDVPQLFGHTAGIQTPLAVESQLDMTISVANLPAAGELSVYLFFARE